MSCRCSHSRCSSFSRRRAATRRVVAVAEMKPPAPTVSPHMALARPHSVPSTVRPYIRERAARAGGDWLRDILAQQTCPVSSFTRGRRTTRHLFVSFFNQSLSSRRYSVYCCSPRVFFDKPSLAMLGQCCRRITSTRRPYAVSPPPQLSVRSEPSASFSGEIHFDAVEVWPQNDDGDLAFVSFFNSVMNDHAESSILAGHARERPNGNVLLLHFYERAGTTECLLLA